MKKQQGFTLIELMIVVAVIGVLSAIAIPQYQKYVAKSEAASALATLTGLKTNAEAYTVESGEFPTGAINDELGAPSTALGTIAFLKGASAGEGTITMTFDKGAVSPSINGKAIQLKRDASGAWVCNTSSSMDAGVKPKNCKTSI
ncbi:pilin [Photobacterium leiognathi]|uniref:pilin n=1 Tax=Photobacterium leiognathi TaxID=553611 RepID=UPI000D158456|nr:pilin [Photobacterium leiognathi]PSW56510.1 prepilin-type cleavage/methylation domain-containing protein [Photobacterium leiognathi subsp. mandapamensis]